MLDLHSILVFLHVLAASAWLGAAMWVAGDVRRTLAFGPPHPNALPSRVRPALGLDAAAGIATLATGALVMWEEGMGHPPLGIAAGMVLTFVRLGLLVALRRTWRGVQSRLAAGEAVAPGDPAARRMGMISGLAHGAWLLALAGMVGVY
jgi:hypothetical protein